MGGESTGGPRETPKDPRRFLTDADRERVVAAIAEAERGTSGEIRVHLERRSGRDALARARAVFARLGMRRTARRNAVLVYIAVADRRFAIVGDEGIDRVVGDGYWEAIRDAIAERFREGRFTDGICEAVSRVGEVLKAHFPVEPGDVNELPNAPSIGD